MTIERDGRAVPCPTHRATELLCYLLVHRDRAHSRERLADLLWPGEPEQVAKRYLRQALWRLNVTLAGPARGCEAVTTGSGWIRSNLDAVEWLDVAEFEGVQETTRHTDGGRLTEAQAAALENAVHLHRGDLLATWYQDWCQSERGRLQQVNLAMREQLMSCYEARRQYSRGIQHGLAVLVHDPARESTHRALMRLRYRAGDRTGAIRQFQACAAVLETEFGVAPAAQTAALYQQICADRVSEAPVRLVSTQGPAEVLPRPEPRPGDDDWLDAVRMRLEELQVSLTAVHRMIARAGTVALDGAVTRDAG
jgi:DNA-binding SARP family transcriptional activator